MSGSVKRKLRSLFRFATDVTLLYMSSDEMQQGWSRKAKSDPSQTAGITFLENIAVGKTTVGKAREIWCPGYRDRFRKSTGSE